MNAARLTRVAALLVLVPASLAAQSGSGGGGSGGAGGSGSGRGGSGNGESGRGGLTPEQRDAVRDQRRAERQGGGEGGGRPLLEQRIRERFAMVVRNQLRLDDRQMRQLSDVSRKFEGRRRDLNQRERSAREVLRSEVSADRNADNPRVATALQEVLTIQKERTGILEDEDKELTTFLTPVQRARWFALQDQLRRRVDDMRRRAAAGLDPAPPDGPEPPLA